MALIKGRVVDETGRPVSGAAVYYISAPGATPDVAELSEADGQFALSAPREGVYIVGARSDEAGEGRVQVSTGGEDPPPVQIRLA